MRFSTFLMGLLLFFGAFVNGAFASAVPDDTNSAVLYAYFRIGDDERDSAGLSLEDFESHIREIAEPDSGYTPLPLDRILKAQDKGTPLPPKTIHLTFDGTDSSFIRNAFPLLEKYAIPFTLFIAAGMMDDGEKTHDSSTLTWDDVRKIQKSPLATIGISGYAYTHIDSKSEETLTSDINHARVRIREELGVEPRYFSYPYGETSPAFLNVIKRQGFSAAFGQQSGVVAASSNRLFLPRFTMIDDFADLDRFRMTAVTLPFPVTDMTPLATISQSNPPAPVSFTIAQDIPLSALKKLKCYASGMSNLTIKKEDSRRVTIAFSDRFDDSKGRLNCTLPAPPLDGEDTPRWRWLGFQFTF